MKVLYFLLIFVGNVAGQDLGGTIIVLVGTQNKIVIAADSRKTVSERGQNVRSMDTDCKISALPNNLVFASAGRRGHLSLGNPQFTWDAYDIARKVAGALNPGQGFVRSAAEAWARQVIGKHDMDSRRGVIDPASAAKNEIESAFFSGIENAHPIVYRVDIIKAPPVEGSPSSYIYKISDPLRFEPFRFHPIGLTDVALEFGTQTPRARDWMETFQREHEGQSWDTTLPDFAERMVKLTAQFSVERNIVGGPTDLVEVTARGIHWLRSKPGCR
jgi:hypothetical protein